MVRLHDRAAGEDLPTYEEAATRRAAEVRIAELEARLRALEGTPGPPDPP